MLFGVNKSLGEDTHIPLHRQQRVNGMAVCWAPSAVYFICLRSNKQSKQAQIANRHALRHLSLFEAEQQYSSKNTLNTTLTWVGLTK